MPSRNHDTESDPVAIVGIVLRLLVLVIAFAAIIGAILSLPASLDRLQDALLALGGGGR